MGKQGRNLGREQRRNEIEAARIKQQQAAAEADHPIARLTYAPTPLARLYAVTATRGWLDELEAGSVAELREVGVSWAKIGAALGVTGQAVSKRYGRIG